MKVFNLALSLVLSSATTSYALANDDAEHLIISCQELLKIYSKRDQQHLLAGLTTSTSEALRAGYCRGVLDEFRRSNESCTQSNWYVQAESIAKYSVYAEKQSSVKSLLKQSCEL